MRPCARVIERSRARADVHACGRTGAAGRHHIRHRAVRRPAGRLTRTSQEAQLEYVARYVASYVATTSARSRHAEPVRPRHAEPRTDHRSRLNAESAPRRPGSPQSLTPWNVVEAPSRPSQRVVLRNAVCDANRELFHALRILAGGSREDGRSGMGAYGSDAFDNTHLVIGFRHSRQGNLLRSERLGGSCFQAVLPYLPYPPLHRPCRSIRCHGHSAASHRASASARGTSSAARSARTHDRTETSCSGDRDGYR